ncbi:hypothetical protein DFJ58DRAFT_666062 [Suillus subalutaceus]|uniref:uncharacterized protein n=1 Tax=Suillus subalutaceus TaxID=48586 RepID=UPI001B86D871|nr:uncharacterized protein DFJ58DRAFT_666062 [Suillus subalutaceus]KAG1842276.1 hypothetical protein DFJ58DRAFT_666062 [Suillus subalutaceus]
MLHELPTEIALYIASYLTLQSLRNVSLVSRKWHSIITDNAQAVYRNAAILHRFILYADLQADSSGQTSDTKQIDWSQFCQRRSQIERGWRGKAPFIARELNSTGKFVHRIKVDQKEKIVMTTRHTGGLSVTDYNTDRVLWATAHVVDYAHCEYDHGYIIFNSQDDSKEVWRYARDFQDSQIPEDFKPDDSMVEASREAAQRHASPTNRGHFRPWALLHMPESTRAFRFSYPTLLSAGANNAYLWDVPTSRLVETISNIQAPNQDGILGSICYVEVNDQYAFFCGSNQLRIFARGGGALVYHLCMKDLQRITWDVLPDNSDEPCPSSFFQPQRLHEAYHVCSTSRSNFVAAHVSSSGKDIAVLTASGIFIWIPGFERLFHREATLDGIATLLNFNASRDNVRDISIYLALGESNEKAAIGTRKGLFIVSLDPEISKLTAEAPPRPGLSVCRVAKYDNSRYLSSITCLQMTDTEIFFNWYPSSEQSRPTQHTQRMMVIPPPPQHGHLQVPIHIVPSPQPQPQHANQVQAPVQPVPVFGMEGQNDYPPGLDPIESSDDDEMGEDAAPDPPSPTNAEEAGPPPLAETHEEGDEDEGDEVDGGNFVENADDFEMDSEVEDDMDDEFQVGGDGKHLSC